MGYGQTPKYTVENVAEEAKEQIHVGGEVYKRKDKSFVNLACEYYGYNKLKTKRMHIITNA